MKKHAAMVALTLGWLLEGDAAMAQEGFRVVDTISGISLKFIQSALPELTRRGLELDGYRVIVTIWNGRHVVIFEDFNAPPGQKGSTRGKPGFEVELSEDGEVVRSHFSR